MDIKEVETPCYIIDENKFNANCMEFEREFSRAWGNNIVFGYSVKTNHHQQMLTLAKKRKWYAEVVSEKEYRLAIQSGFLEENIIFNGPIKGNIFYSAIGKKVIINIDNFEEIFLLIENKYRLMCSVGIRVNFDLEKECPGETTAGENPSRFGFCYENGDLKRAIILLKENDIKLDGLHMHVSTKTRSKKVFYEISKMVCVLKREFNLKLKYIDIGGGFFGGRVLKGYPLISEYAEVICSTLKEEFSRDKISLILEPGAAVIATAVNYVTKVNSVRQVRDECIVTVDGSLLHINPFMRKKRILDYEIMGKTGGVTAVQQICGNTCMENDRLLLLRYQKELNRKNYIIFHNVGAYTVCMNNYFINDPPKVLLKTEKGLLRDIYS